MVMVVVGLLHLASVVPAGVAEPLLFLNVVVAARLWGTAPALCAAAVAAGAYSYYFLPPAGFGIEDPEDWVAFITFTVTAVIAGELASRAERRAAEAQAGRQEIERLYQELQGAFERASEAEAARRNEQLKAALLDALRHNLRTPLTAIKAAVTALIRAVRTAGSELSADEHSDLLQVIDEESDRLNRFIEGLSTPDPSEPPQPLHLRAVAVGDIIKAGLTRAETLTRDHRVVVRVDGELPSLSVDAASIAEVIYILLDNASKYAPPRTALTISASRADERHVCIAVTDEGPGIPADLRERGLREVLPGAGARIARLASRRDWTRTADCAAAGGRASRPDVDRGWRRRPRRIGPAHLAGQSGSAGEWTCANHGGRRTLNGVAL